METVDIGTLGYECSVCGKRFKHRLELDENKHIKNLVTKHNECMAVTKRIIEIKEQIKELQTKLLDEEFTLFCIRMSKNECDV